MPKPMPEMTPEESAEFDHDLHPKSNEPEETDDSDVEAPDTPTGPSVETMAEHDERMRETEEFFGDDEAEPTDQP